MPEPALLATLGIATEAVKTADDAISAIGKLVGKLRAQPDLAALKLSAALTEVLKTYGVVDEAINTYGSLALDTDALTTRSKELLAISGGSLDTLVVDGRGSCGKIWTIYDVHLDRWFSRVFNRKEQDAMREAFIGVHGLGFADNGLFDVLTDVASRLTESARDRARPLVLAGDHADARTEIVTTYRELAPLQQQLAASTKQMAGLKNDFIGLARAT